MARKPRVEFEGASYHVMARGNERAKIFHGREDYELFLGTLEESLVPFRGLVHAWCLMLNHYHLAVTTPRGNLSRWMAWLQTTFTSRYNRRHHRSGHLFQGRYRAELLDCDAYARQLVLYIHLNPVRRKDKDGKYLAGGMKELAAFTWSSHQDYLISRRKDAISWDRSWLHYWGRNRAEATTRYRADLQAAFTTEAFDWHGEIAYGLVAGGGDLVRKVLGLLENKSDGLSVKWKEKAVVSAKRVKLEKALAAEKNQDLRLWVYRQLLGEKASLLAKRFGYKDGSGVRHAVRRISIRRREDRDLQILMDRYESLSRFMD